MKQMLFSLLIVLASFSSLRANPTETPSSNPTETPTASPYEGTAWNVIRERLFNGENSKAFRFEEDIRLQVIGADTHRDSAVFVQLVDELNKLLETVQVKMVDTNPNFKLTVVQHQGGLSTSTRRSYIGYKMTSVTIELGFPESYSDKESVKQIYYHIIRELTILYNPQHGSSLYGGIFDSSKAAEAEFTDIDKEILRLLYSADFYKKLRTDTVEKHGYTYYLDLRYKKQLKNLSYGFKAFLLLFGFLFFLSRESKREKNPRLLQYIKQRALILLLLPFFFSLIKTTGINMPIGYLIAFYLSKAVIIICFGIVVLVLLYYIEPIFLKRIKNFAGRQALVFLSTTIVAIVVPTTFMKLLSLILYPFSDLNPVSLWYGSSTLFLLIVLLAALRVFYNFINYRIQSMVNQKDVEIARMKELKNQAELNALHSRINPHFLYNSLNSIASLAHIDAGKTENMALGLSELFRYSINKENKTVVSVAEELEMVKKYVSIR